MATQILYMHPLETQIVTIDFADDIPTADTALYNVGAGSTITMADSGGTLVDSLLSAKTRTSKTLLVTIGPNLVSGQDYVVSFLGQGSTSGARFLKTVAVRCRADIQGAF